MGKILVGTVTVLGKIIGRIIMAVAMAELVRISSGKGRFITSKVSGARIGLKLVSRAKLGIILTEGRIGRKIRARRGVTPRMARLLGNFKNR